MKKVISLVIVILFLAGCASAPPRPDWMNSQPDGSMYYIGIAGSSTGNEAEDREAAKNRALAAIASQIAVEVQAEMEYVSSEENVQEGRRKKTMNSQKVTDKIVQMVNQNLREVETVETYYSKDSGFWVYVRMNKARWIFLQQQEQAELVDRVENILMNAYGTKQEPSLARRVSVLQKSVDTLTESPYAYVVKSDITGRDELLIDVLDARLDLEVSDLKFVASLSDSSYSLGENPVIRGNVSLANGNPAEDVPLMLLIDGKKAASFTVSRGGEIDYVLDGSLLKMGMNRFVLRPDISVMGLNADSAELLVLPEIEYAFEVNPILASFRFDSGEFEELGGGYREQVLAFFTEAELPFQFSGANENIEIEFKWNISDFPKNKLSGNLYFSQVGCTVTLLKEGRSLFTKKYKPSKEGGLDYVQARTRAADKIIALMETDDAFVRELNAEFRKSL